MKQLPEEFLKNLRLQHHLTQQQVAHKLGITRQAYAYYENHNTIPDLEIIIKLSTLYNISIRTFLKYYPADSPAQLAEPHPYRTHFEKHDIYPEYLTFFSQHDNMKKYHHLNIPEKKMIFMFQKLSEEEQNELIRLAYLKSIISPDSEFFTENKKE